MLAAIARTGTGEPVLLSPYGLHYVETDNLGLLLRTLGRGWRPDPIDRCHETDGLRLVALWDGRYKRAPQVLTDERTRHRLGDIL